MPNHEKNVCWHFLEKIAVLFQGRFSQHKGQKCETHLKSWTSFIGVLSERDWFHQKQNEQSGPRSKIWKCLSMVTSRAHPNLVSVFESPQRRAGFETPTEMGKLVRQEIPTNGVNFTASLAHTMKESSIWAVHINVKCEEANFEHKCLYTYGNQLLAKLMFGMLQRKVILSFTCVGEGKFLFATGTITLHQYLNGCGWKFISYIGMSFGKIRPLDNLTCVNHLKGDCQVVPLNGTGGI